MFDVVRVDGVELATFLGVHEDFVGLLDTFEEGVVVGIAGTCFLVWVVLEDLLAVRDLDLLGRSVDAEMRKTEDGVVVVFLEVK